VPFTATESRSHKEFILSRQTFRLNLLAADFPFLSDNFGRSVVYPAEDMHYQRVNAFSGSEADKNIGIPQLIFCENVMPASYGIQSITYTNTVNRTGTTNFDQGLYLRDSAENRTLFSPGVVGTTANRYTYNAATQVWTSSPVTVPSGAKCTVSNVKKRTFVCFQFHNTFYEWTGVWVALAFTGITAANIKGLVAANAYNVLYDKDTIYYSSTLDPTDFVPSLITGAGSQKVLGIKGDIVVCYPIDDGFVIHTTGNAIVAKYSQNTRFPWTFKEIKNSAGIADPEHATSQGAGTDTYVYSTNGLMRNTLTQAVPDFPALNEFLGSRRFEVWDAVNKSLSFLDLTNAPVVKLTFIANRWLVISYGAVTLDYALVYDVALKRWGKLKITHVDCFEFFGNTGSAGNIQADTWLMLNGTWAQQFNTWAEYGNLILGGAASLTTPYKSFGFLQKDGGVQVVNFDNSASTDDSVALIGKIQFLRDKLFTLSEIDAEGIGSEAQTKMQIWVSLDGLNIARKVYPSKLKSAGLMQKWGARETGLNFTLGFYGNFRLTTVVVRGPLAGKR
jgi:hypothetical protein